MKRQKKKMIKKKIEFLEPSITTYNALEYVVFNYPFLFENSKYFAKVNLSWEALTEINFKIGLQNIQELNHLIKPLFNYVKKGVLGEIPSIRDKDNNLIFILKSIPPEGKENFDNDFGEIKGYILEWP